MSANATKENAVMEDGWFERDSGNPPTSKLILVTVKTPDGGELDTACPECECGSWSWNCRNHPDAAIVAWKPLPNPYNYDPEGLAKKEREEELEYLKTWMKVIEESVEALAGDCEEALDVILASNATQLEPDQWKRSITDLKDLVDNLHEHQGRAGLRHFLGN